MLHQLLPRFDTDGNGRISHAEFHKGSTASFLCDDREVTAGPRRWRHARILLAHRARLVRYGAHQL
jgi:hypothetical protein